MLKGSPFPKFHAKAVETKAMLAPLAAFLRGNKENGKIQGGEAMDIMIKLVEGAHAMDVLADGYTGFAVKHHHGQELVRLVYAYNINLSKLCHFFHQKGIFLFNFIPKNDYFFHLAQQGILMNPKLAWCYQGEDLMHKVKTLAQANSHATVPRKLGSKILATYLVALDLELS